MEEEDPGALRREWLRERAEAERQEQERRKETIRAYAAGDDSALEQI